MIQKSLTLIALFSSLMFSTHSSAQFGTWATNLFKRGSKINSLVKGNELIAQNCKVDVRLKNASNLNGKASDEQILKALKEKLKSLNYVVVTNDDESTFTLNLEVKQSIIEKSAVCEIGDFNLNIPEANILLQHATSSYKIDMGSKDQPNATLLKTCNYALSGPISPIVVCKANPELQETR